MRERQLLGELGAAVRQAPAEQRELDLLALVQARERAHTVGRRVSGDEQDRLKMPASPVGPDRPRPGGGSIASEHVRRRPRSPRRSAAM